MSKWIKIEKRLPEDDRHVIAYMGDASRHSMLLSSYRDGQWWATYTSKLGGVTRWMDFPGEPKDFAYWWNRLREWLDRRKHNVQQMSDWTAGRTSKNAHLDKKPIFYRDSSGKLMTGLPENYSAPKGCEKIICNNVFEAERLSEAQRRQERAEWNAHMEERRSIEEPGLNEIRRNRQTLIANARNNLNRDFLIAAQERLGNRPKPWEHERESFLHNEGYEERR